MPRRVTPFRILHFRPELAAAAFQEKLLAAELELDVIKTPENTLRRGQLGHSPMKRPVPAFVLGRVARLAFCRRNIPAWTAFGGNFIRELLERGVAARGL